FTFSTKPVDASGLSYYGFRFYNPELGRWMSRDPISELGNCVRLFPEVQKIVYNVVREIDFMIERRIAIPSDKPYLNNLIKLASRETVEELRTIRTNFLNSYYTRSDLREFIFCSNNSLDSFDYLGLADDGTKVTVEFIIDKLVNAGSEIPGKGGKFFDIVDVTKKSIEGYDTLTGAEKSEANEIIQKMRKAYDEIHSEKFSSDDKHLTCVFACRELVRYFECDILEIRVFCEKLCSRVEQ
ncbi:MAG: RHS repeat-associated core domain-containing protein, partial [Patescibacteria group bacterium]